ncbi:MAG: transglutaminase family protein [Alphaproteobacteria bacterium]|nr:transglutaminase family protein [Alphaproteobacteria bacterium]MBU1515869.1 transglutaminase family protein [Alphaproteobacteria bacterium]MBU2094091.1 transglutaminase family protein [Alphaproteobacteria bacterium]MBU2151443.1 transglutaminase family protein [Alphaproteobacteria bacterium]MBU2305281.1 transglutaminase family protein [Alphaproteobacteria bacterium]
MRLSISHVTTYHYARPVQLHPHQMMLRPRGSHDVRVLNHDLRCRPAAELAWTQDVFGNLIATAVFSQPVSELVISSSLSVETSADAWPILRIDPAAHAYPYAHPADEITDLGALAQPQPFDAAVDSWARAFIYSVPTDTLSLLKDLNAGILGAAFYRTRDEEGTQTAAETLRMASGSCRDLAALFIEAVRHLGFGARAVSGYLFDPDGVEASDTTHAWAEVYLPGAGWVSFDPTHNRLGGAGLIPVAVGRRNAQVMPVAGSYVGDPEDFLNMEVDVAIERTA